MWSNKLYVAEKFNYICGPAGFPVPSPNEYIVRPIINLGGMGVGARIQHIEPNQLEKVPAGYFWSEVFTGKHYSVDYVREKDEWKQLNCYQGYNSREDLTRFSMWQRIDEKVKLPEELKEIDVERLNVEMIDHKVIEVHLRNGFDHMMDWKYIIPCFKGDPTRKEGYRFIKGKATGHGGLLYPREGYLVK